MLFLIHHTIQAGLQAGTPVSMCGEMASNPRLTRLLVGLGLREFSTHPSSLLEIKQIINSVSAKVLQGPVPGNPGLRVSGKNPRHGRGAGAPLIT